MGVCQLVTVEIKICRNSRAFWDSLENYCPTGQFSQQLAEQTE